MYQCKSVLAATIVLSLLNFSLATQADTLACQVSDAPLEAGLNVIDYDCSDSEADLSYHAKIVGLGSVFAGVNFLTGIFCLGNPAGIYTGVRAGATFIAAGVDLGLYAGEGLCLVSFGGRIGMGASLGGSILLIERSQWNGPVTGTAGSIRNLDEAKKFCEYYRSDEFLNKHPDQHPGSSYLLCLKNRTAHLDLD